MSTAKPSGEEPRKRRSAARGEPSGKGSGTGLRFVVHKHAATQLHYDLRLELDGSLKSWAIPKGPSLDPKAKRLAVQVEDHSLDYIDFEGCIPAGRYGAGEVIVWDRGHWQPQDDPVAGYRAGKLRFSLVGEKLGGAWSLVRTRLKGSGDKQQWLLIKARDQAAKAAQDYDIVAAQPQSVISGKLIEAAPRHEPAARQDAPAQAAGSGQGARTGEGRERVAGVWISHPQRIIDGQSGASKLDLARFYAQIADWILPGLDDRPVSLLRAPDGLAGEQFFQRHGERLAIPKIKHLDLGHPRLMEIDNVQALVGAVQMGTIELHTWGATRQRIDTPDLFVLDLDPDPALPWRRMLEAAWLILAELDQLGLQAFVKTSGSRGLHLTVPLARRADWDTVGAFAKALAQFMARQQPERFSATMGPNNRVGRVFIDYLRNSRGASTVAPYSVRARPGLPVAVPIRRDELDALRSAQQWTIANLQRRLDRLPGNPWQGYGHRQRLSRAMWDKLGAEAP